MEKPDEFWKNKAELLKKSGKFEEALIAFDKASKFEQGEEKSDTWYQKACSYSEIGNYEKAMECLENEIKFNKPSFDALYVKGIILCISKNYSEAIECFNKAYESTFDEFLDSDNLAKSLKEHKKFEKAVMVTDQANTVKTISQKFWYFKGIALFGIKKFEEALECFNKALKTGQESAELFYEMAKSQLMIGKIDDVIDSIEKACTIDPSFRKVLSVDPIFESLKENQKFRQIRDFDIIKHT